MNYEVKEQLYEGKAKQVFSTNDPEIVMVHYKDDATAGDGEKKGTIRDKGIVNNKLSNALMQKLEKEGIPTHYVEEVNDRDTFVKKVEIVPLEVIVRNVAAGHFSLRMGVPEGKVFKTPILEYSYKNDDLHDPFINHYYALALDLATQEELDTIAKYAFKVNEVLKKIMLDANIRLVPTSSSSSAACLTAPSFWQMRSAPTPAASGMPPPVPIWTRTSSAATWAVRPTPIRRS